MPEHHRRSDEDGQSVGDRLITIEMTLKSIEKSISGGGDSEGLVGRLNRHGRRILVIENAMMVGTGVFLAVGTGAAMAKDVFVEWMKKKILGN